MEKIIDKLWNWGHLEGSHNECTKLNCKMSPEEFANVYGIKKAFIVSYGGNIQPPFDRFAKRFSCLDEIKWSVVGDSGSPDSDNELGDTDNIIDTAKTHSNITGGVMDDFFTEKRMKKYPPEVLSKIHSILNQNGMDFWCVLYDHDLDKDLSEYIECFDGISFWIWGCEKINNMEQYIEKLFKIINGKRIMLGMYLWDYKGDGKQPMDAYLFEKQLKFYLDLLRNRNIEGIVFCSSTVGNAELESNKILKNYIEKYGQEII